MKHFLLALVIPFAASRVAEADDAASKRAEAQRKIDEAKVKGCQSFRTMLTANKSCPDQAKVAATLACTVKTYDEMADLQHACAGVLRAKADAMKGAEAGSGSASPSPVAKCTITKVAGQDVAIDVSVAHHLLAESWCKTSVRTEAEKWLTTHASCVPGKTTFPFTFTFGVPGKEATFDHTGYCRSKK